MVLTIKIKLIKIKKNFLRLSFNDYTRMREALALNALHHFSKELILLHRWTTLTKHS